MAVHRRRSEGPPPPPGPPPPNQSDHRGKKRNLQLGKSGWAIFGTQTFGTPPPCLRIQPLSCTRLGYYPQSAPSTHHQTPPCTPLRSRTRHSTSGRRLTIPQRNHRHLWNRRFLRGIRPPGRGRHFVSASPGQPVGAAHPQTENAVAQVTPAVSSPMHRKRRQAALIRPEPARARGLGIPMKGARAHVTWGALPAEMHWKRVYALGQGSAPICPPPPPRPPQQWGTDCCSRPTGGERLVPLFHGGPGPPSAPLLSQIRRDDLSFLFVCVTTTAVDTQPTAVGAELTAVGAQPTAVDGQLVPVRPMAHCCCGPAATLLSSTTPLPGPAPGPALGRRGGARAPNRCPTASNRFVRGLEILPLPSLQADTCPRPLPPSVALPFRGCAPRLQTQSRGETGPPYTKSVCFVRLWFS